MRKISARKSPQQDRSRETVNKILGCTKKILIDHGIERLTTNNIAKEASISIGSLYQYFPNKLAILKELYARWLVEVQIELSDFLLNTPGIEKFERQELESLLFNYYSYCVENGTDILFERELSKAIGVYRELKVIDEKHGIEISKIFSLFLEKTGSKECEEERLLTGYYIYQMHNVLILSIEAKPEHVESLLRKHSVAVISVILGM